MFEDTAKRIDNWNNKVEYYKKKLEEAREIGDEDMIIDAHLSLEEAEAELNYAWQDDALEEAGLK